MKSGELMKNCVLILNYNDYNSTKKLVDNLSAEKMFDYIVVVDNNSTDDSYEKLLEFHNDYIHIIKTDKNGGYGYGNNYGFKYLKNLVDDRFNLLICNPDVEFDAKLVLDMCNNISDTKSVIGPVITETHGLNRGWKIPSVFKSTLQNVPLINRLKIAKINYDNNCYDSEFTKVEAVSGSIFAIDSEIFEEIGMFDENVFLYYEENILASSLKKKGYNVYVDNNVSVFHNHSVSIDNAQSIYGKLKILKTSQWYFHKTYSNSNVFSLLLLRFSIAFILLLAKVRDILK